MVRELVVGWFGDVVRTVKERKVVFFPVVGLIALLVVFGAWKGKNWYVAHREGKAQLAFSDALDTYQTALYYAVAKSNDKAAVEDHIKDALIDLTAVIQKHSGSALADYTQAFIADLYTLKGEHDRALETLEKALAHMNVNSPLYCVYRTKAALLLFDNGKEAEGLAALQALADDAKNKQSDDAAYYLGSYYWSKEQYADAANAWSRFKQETTQTQDASTVSPWAPMVWQKLAQIS